MYCVNCGVQLEQGVERCPLCATPVWNPPNTRPESHYNPKLYPVRGRGKTYAGLVFVAILLLNVCLSCFIACMVVYGRLYWSGIVMLGCALAYVLFFLPLWFRRPAFVVFVPVDFAAVCGYVLYICHYTGGDWFLSFAFPCGMLCFIFTFLAMGLGKLKLSGKTRLRLVGLYFLLLGGGTMLLELFEHITFHTAMFTWSLYTAANLGLIGLFLFVASFIPHLRGYLAKTWFV